MSAVADVDYSGAETLGEIRAELDEKGVRLVFANLMAQVREELDRLGVTDLVGSDAYFETVEEAIDAYPGANAPDEGRYGWTPT